MSGLVLLYGATGYIGQLLARRFQAHAAQTGIQLVLGGRDPAKLAALSRSLDGVRWRDFPLEDPDEIEEALHGVAVVLNAAGPFSRTAEPVMDACLRKRVHYLDLSGEWRVFAAAMDRSSAAAAAGIMLMPGVGFTIVAGDCLMGLAASRVADAVSLRLAFSSPTIVAPGTALTAAASLEPLGLSRRDDKLVGAPLGRVTRAFDFGGGLKNATLINLPELLTGEFTTGVRRIETYLEVTQLQRLACIGAGAAMAVVGAEPIRQLAEAFAGMGTPEPTLTARRAARYDLVVEATDPWRRVRTFRARTLDGYSVTLATAPHIVQRVLDRVWRPGFQTPAAVFGCDFFFQELNCAALDPTLQTTESSSAEVRR
jgi:short subunit dehydrogenase-like uncharacterized protein